MVFEKNQKCTKCGEPDEFSDETLCGQCIEKWRNSLIAKEKQKQIDFLRNIADEINKIKIRLANGIPKDCEIWDELYHIKQELLEKKIAELKKEINDVSCVKPVVEEGN